MRPDEAPPPSSSSHVAQSASGVATRDDRLARLRELYAKGDVESAMALAAELAQERSDPEPPRPGKASGDSVDASIWVEYGPEVSIDVSLRGLGHRHGADAPDASIQIEYGEVDVSLTGLEPFAHDAIDVSISSLGGVADDPSNDMSLQGLSGIIGEIESSEHTLEFRRPLSQKALLMKQRLLAEQLGGVAPFVTMPVEEPRALPEVLTSEVPFPHAPGMRASTRPSPSSAPLASSLTLTERQRVPRVVITPSEIAKLPIDPRGGFLLAQVDGMQTVDEILDVCAMPPATAIELLAELEALGVIRIE